MSLRSIGLATLPLAFRGMASMITPERGHHVLVQVLLSVAGEVDIPYPDRGRRNQEDSD